MLLNVSKVLLFACRVDDYEQVIASVGDHQVIQDAAVLIGKQCVTLHTHWQVHNVHWNEGLKCSSGTFPM
ncbi:hypothetical protein D3C75_750010 [compost metagenome]